MDLRHLPGKWVAQRKRLLPGMNVRMLLFFCLLLADIFWLAHVFRTIGIPTQIQSLLVIGKSYLAKPLVYPGILTFFIVGTIIAWLYRKLIRPYFWRHSDAWWVLAWQLFSQSVTVLVLWVFVSIVLFVFLYRAVLPPLNIGDTGPIPFKETLAGLTAVVTGIIGFAAQQWKTFTSEQTKRQEQREQEYLEKIEEISSLLDEGEYALAARRYIALEPQLRRNARLHYRLHIMWEEKTPTKLRDAILLIRDIDGQTSYIRDHLRTDNDRKRYKEALEWAQVEIGHAFRSQILRVLYDLGAVKSITKQQWPYFVKSMGLPTRELLDSQNSDALLCESILALNWQKNPFPALKSELEPWAISGDFEVYIEPSWWSNIEQKRWGIFILPPQSGKTIACMRAVYNTIVRNSTSNSDMEFPVYWRVKDRPTLIDMSNAILQTIINYIMFTPESFISLPTIRQYKLVRLAGLCSGGDIVKYVRGVGVPSKGEGKIVMDKIKDLSEDLEIGDCSEGYELLFLLKNALPYGFSRVLVFADVQGERSLGDVHLLHNMGQMLSVFDIYLKAFITVDQSDRSRLKPLCWEKEELKHMIERRIEWVRGDAQRGESSYDNFISICQDCLEKCFQQRSCVTPGQLVNACRKALQYLGEKQITTLSPSVSEILKQGLEQMNCPSC